LGQIISFCKDLRIVSFHIIRSVSQKLIAAPLQIWCPLSPWEYCYQKIQIRKKIPQIKP
jgi:hypothetical protein